jgi:hypothetical protein
VWSWAVIVLELMVGERTRPRAGSSVAGVARNRPACSVAEVHGLVDERLTWAQALAPLRAVPRTQATA